MRSGDGAPLMPVASTTLQICRLRCHCAAHCWAFAGYTKPITACTQQGIPSSKGNEELCLLDFRSWPQIRWITLLCHLPPTGKWVWNTRPLMEGKVSKSRRRLTAGMLKRLHDVYVYWSRTFSFSESYLQPAIWWIEWSVWLFRHLRWVIGFANCHFTPVNW